MGKGKGVVTSFQLVPENIGSSIFLQVRASKSRGYGILLVISREHRELELP
jgi:hypothetical protein